MKVILITGCDSGYFELAKSLVRSLRRFPSLAQLPIGFLDFGLDDTQRGWLDGENVQVKPGGWDMDFPGREVWEATRPWFKIYLCRPHLRSHFPGYDVYCWLDADTWVQQPEALEHYVNAAARGGLAASPEVDRSYYKFSSNFEAWETQARIAEHCLGAELGKRLRLTPNFNAGVFAIRHDSPHWDAWRHYLHVALARVDPQEDVARLAEQVALNAAIYLHESPVHRLPSTYNWLACLALPCWDVDRAQFVEPAPPYAPISILHLSLFVLREPMTIGVVHDARAWCTVRTSLTLDSVEKLISGKSQLMAKIDQLRAQAL
jgi:hypothetical protein